MKPTRLFILTLLAALALVAAGSATAATPCWRQVVNDWYKNGRVVGHYPISCYSEAIANLPEDSKQYSSAPQDIRRDMLLAMRDDSNGTGGGTSGPGAGTSGPGAGTSGPGAGGYVPTGFGGVGVGLGTGLQAASKTSKDTGFLGNVFDTFGPKNASSIPLPLIILAAVALLLLAAGAASFIARRLNARRVDPPRP